MRAGDPNLPIVLYFALALFAVALQTGPSLMLPERYRGFPLWMIPAISLPVIVVGALSIAVLLSGRTRPTIVPWSGPLGFLAGASPAIYGILWILTHRI